MESIAKNIESHGQYEPDESSSSEASLLDLLNLLLRRWRLVLGVPLLSVVLVVLLVLFSPRTYSAGASLLPQHTPTTSRLSGIASQFGISVDDPSPGESSEFYAALLTSREILDSVVETHYSFRSGTETISGNLTVLFDAKGATRGERHEAAEDKLKDAVAVAVDRQTGMVRLTITTKSPFLSYELADRMLQLVSQFDLNRRQARARAEGTFIGQQVETARQTLLQAENRLQEFLEGNRLYQNDPQLVFEHERLQRNVDMRQQIYTTLAQSYEQARIDAVRDTPPVAIVEHPKVPARPDSRGTLSKLVLWMVLGVLVGIMAAVAREFFARSYVKQSSGWREFAARRAQFATQVRGLLHLKHRSPT